MFHRIRALETALLILAVVGCVLHRQSETGSFCVARLRWVGAFRPKNAMQPRVLPVQTKDTKSLGAGKLLVASRELGDPRFAETVILLVQYDAQGVVGLILNRRTDIPLSRVLDGLKAAKDRSDPVYFGGPVETPTVFALFQSPAKIEGAEHICSGVYLISAKTLFEKVISAQPWHFSCLSGLRRMDERSIAEGGGAGRVVHFSPGRRHGFQLRSGFLVVGNDSEDRAKVRAERGYGRRPMDACW